MMRALLRIGTRGSQLALWQARTVAASLERVGVAVELAIIRTSGDRLQEAPLSEVGGKRLFVKEIEDALLREEVDIAVHSAKDMPAEMPAGLALAATLPRDDPRDVLVLPAGATPADYRHLLPQLGPRPRFGTSSVRRSAQLAVLVPGAVFAPIRGNVDTRLRKLDSGEYDALVLAAAGIRRLGLAERISASFPPEACVPAPGQGIVAMQTRATDEESRRAVHRVHDAAAGVALDAERAVVSALGGGCMLPLGALATVRGADVTLEAVVLSRDGARAVRAHGAGKASDPRSLGLRIADDLARQGAGEVLDEARRAHGAVEDSY